MKRSFLIASTAVVAIFATTFTASAHGKMGKGMAVPAFEELDLNSDGQISTDELAAQGKIRFDKMDENKDGKLSQDELTAGMSEKANKRMEKRQGKMFSKMDENDDGFLTLEEMSDGRADKMQERMMKRFDDNDDGSISKEEYDAMAEKAKKRGGKSGKKGDHSKDDS